MTMPCLAATPLPHPLNLIVPAPGEALRLAYYKTTPDETVANKVKHLENVVREANPNAPPWSIYLTPTAATTQIKGWEADLNRPDTPLPEATLDLCLEWLSKAAGLTYKMEEECILIETLKENEVHNNRLEATGETPAPQP